MNTTSLAPKGRLLIIDDESELIEVLSDILENSAAEICRANDGSEGIDFLKKQSFDAVLSDEKMPKKSGLEVLRWMRENGINTPFIMHTGHRRTEVLSEAEKLNIYAFLDKPWSEKALIRTVEEALESGMKMK